MKYYMAPLEGITGYVFRNAFQTYFGKADKYFTPFIAPNQMGRLSAREKNDILPEHNRDMHTVPQLLTNRAEDFCKTAELLKDMGYEEINLNLGCPSATVAGKGKGAGFLAKPEELAHFLDTIFERAEVRISVKTRIGWERPEEFEQLLSLFNRYPLEELIVHPRTRQEFYGGLPNWDMFEAAREKSGHPVCYNGDIFSTEDHDRLLLRFHGLEHVMLGRGLLRNPCLLERLRQQADIGACEDKADSAGEEKHKIQQFHDTLYEDYQGVLCGDKNVLFKMKELWSYLILGFTNHEPYAKKIKKAERRTDYETAVRALFAEQDWQA